MAFAVITPQAALMRMHAFNNRVARLFADKYKHDSSLSYDFNKLGIEIKEMVFIRSLALLSNSSRKESIMKLFDKSHEFASVLRFRGKDYYREWIKEFKQAYDCKHGKLKAKKVGNPMVYQCLKCGIELKSKD